MSATQDPLFQHHPDQEEHRRRVTERYHHLVKEHGEEDYKRVGEWVKKGGRHDRWEDYNAYKPYNQVKPQYGFIQALEPLAGKAFPGNLSGHERYSGGINFEHLGKELNAQRRIQRLKGYGPWSNSRANPNFSATIERGLNDLQSQSILRALPRLNTRRSMHHRRGRRHHRRHHHKSHSIKHREHHMNRVWRSETYNLRVKYPHYLRLTSNVAKRFDLINGAAANTYASGQTTVALVNGLGVLIPSIEWFLEVDDAKVLMDKFANWKVLALMMSIRVVKTQNMARISQGAATTTNTLVEQVRDAETEPRMFCVSDLGAFGANPFTIANDSALEAVPRIRRLDIGGARQHFKWTKVKAHMHDKFATSGIVCTGVYASDNPLTFVCQGVNTNQQFKAIYFCMPDYNNFTGNTTTAGGAATFTCEWKGAIIYDCLDNIQSSDQPVN